MAIVRVVASTLDRVVARQRELNRLTARAHGARDEFEYHWRVQQAQK